MLGTKDTKEAMDALESSSGLVRKEIGNKVRLFYTPEVKFELDTSMEYGAHIQNIINELGITHDDNENDGEQEDN